MKFKKEFDGLTVNLEMDDRHIIGDGFVITGNCCPFATKGNSVLFKVITNVCVKQSRFELKFISDSHSGFFSESKSTRIINAAVAAEKTATFLKGFVCDVMFSQNNPEPLIESLANENYPMALVCIYANDKLTDDILGVKCLLDDVIRHESFKPVIDELAKIAKGHTDESPLNSVAKAVMGLFIHGGLSLTDSAIANMADSQRASLILSMILKIRDDNNPVSALFATP